MKITREQVAANRGLILKAATRLFHERGFDDVTVAEVMRAAGLTHGAFYGYFSSKEDLIAQALAHALAPSGEEAQEVDLQKFAATYLSPGHRDNRAGGCSFAALSSEAVRASGDLRHTMTASVRHQIERFSRTAAGRTPADRRQAAIGSWAAMIGALMLARLVDDPQLSDQILSDTRRWLSAGSKE